MSDGKGWQPIETAPENEPFLIYAYDAPLIEGFTRNRMMCSAQRYKYSKNSFTIYGAGGYECEDDFNDPTHWMPFPEPPKETK